MLTKEQIDNIKKLGIDHHFTTATKHSYVCGMTTNQRKYVEDVFKPYGLTLGKCNTCNFNTVKKMAKIYEESIDNQYETENVPDGTVIDLQAEIKPKKTRRKKNG